MIDFRRQALDDLADNFSRGFWTFNASCGGVTYATPYAAMLDGCVQSFEKAYGPFFLENRQSETNLYAQDDWRVTTVADAESRAALRVRRRAEEVEDRIDYIFTADDNNIEPRIGFAYAPAWDSGLLEPLERRAGELLDSRRLGHLRRPAVPVDLLAGRRQRAVQPAQRAQPRPPRCRTSSMSRIRRSASCSCPVRRPAASR